MNAGSEFPTYAMAYDWGRFMWWLSQDGNASAVQAVCAIASAGVTIGLAGLTWRYVRLTKTLAETSRAQLAVLLQPNLVLSAKGVVCFEQGKPVVLCDMSAKNEGAYPVRLDSAYFEHEGLLTAVPDLDGQIVSPGNSWGCQEIPTAFVADPQAGEASVIYVAVYVQCSDLAGINRFEYDYQYGRG